MKTCEKCGTAAGEYSQLLYGEVCSLCGTAGGEVGHGVMPKKRKKSPRMNRDAIAASLGLVKVRGSVSGKTYYE